MDDDNAQSGAQSKQAEQTKEGEQGEQGKHGTLTVLLALAANVAVGLLKLGAGLITGSSALLSEAAHSAGDSTTELLLLVALRRSKRPADRRHPFGYGKERYFWSLMAAGAIFVSGAAFSAYEGLRTIFGPEESAEHIWINYPVLALAAMFEGTSFIQAFTQMRRQARRERRSLPSLVTDPEDPTTNSVALEDSAALVGLGLAAIGVALHQFTGSQVWDGAASLCIACLLLFVAFTLGRATSELLIGKQAPQRLLDDIEKFLEKEQEILDVVDLLTMMVGSGRVLVCVRADFVDAVSSADIEQACMRIDGDMRARFPEVGEIFVQPVSRGDRRIEDRVQARYGEALSDGLADG